MKHKKYISAMRSLAGQIGSSRRWANHEKKPTNQIRIYRDDYYILSSLASSFGSIASVVHCAIVDSCYNNLSVSQAQARANKEL